MKNWIITILAFVSVCSYAAHADEADELIISPIRGESIKIPGTSLKRPADNIIQQLRVSSESPDEKIRKAEIFDTLRLIATAAKDKGMEPCVEVNYRVVPLKIEPATLKIVRGSRADTSEVLICIKTKVNPGVNNAVIQYAKLKEFPASVKPVGRAAIDLYGDIDISIINPTQYREAVIKLYAADVKLVTTSLSAEYRVTTRGIDKQLQWMRDGMTDVVLFIPYEYEVVPVNAR